MQRPIPQLVIALALTLLPACEEQPDRKTRIDPPPPLPTEPITPGEPTGVAHAFVTATAAEIDQHLNFLTDDTLRHQAASSFAAIDATHLQPHRVELAAEVTHGEIDASTWTTLRDEYAATSDFASLDDARSFLQAFTRIHATVYPPLRGQSELVVTGIDWSQPIGVHSVTLNDTATVVFYQWGPFQANTIPRYACRSYGVLLKRGSDDGWRVDAHGLLTVQSPWFGDRPPTAIDEEDAADVLAAAEPLVSAALGNDFESYYDGCSAAVLDDCLHASMLLAPLDDPDRTRPFVPTRGEVYAPYQRAGLGAFLDDYAAAVRADDAPSAWALEDQMLAQLDRTQRVALSADLAALLANLAAQPPRPDVTLYPPMVHDDGDKTILPYRYLQPSLDGGPPTVRVASLRLVIEDDLWRIDFPIADGILPSVNALSTDE